MMASPLFPVEIVPMQGQDIVPLAGVEAQIQAFPWSEGNFKESLSAGYDCWAMRQGSDLIGFAVVMRVIDEAHLLNIGITPARQGQGLGARLLQFASQHAFNQGAIKFFLEVRPSNTQAVKLYRAFGFHEIAKRKNYYPAVEGREDALIFERALPCP